MKKPPRAVTKLEAKMAHVACILFNFWCCCLFAPKKAKRVFSPRFVMAYVFPLCLLQCYNVLLFEETCENSFKFFSLWRAKYVTFILFVLLWLWVEKRKNTHTIDERENLQSDSCTRNQHKA